MAQKNFEPIESDYAFFMAHATEAEHDAARYERELAGFAEGRTTIQMLDFGCGTGDFSVRLLSALDWSPSVLELTLIEPVESQREIAARRLATYSQQAIHHGGRLAPDRDPRFDLIVCNHVLYYVDDLDATLRRLCGSLRPGGRLLLAMAGWDNALMQLWQTGFGLLGRPVPYYAAEDVDASLTGIGARFRKSRVPYQLRFPDTAENRLKILRFLFGEHLQELSPQRLLGEWDRYRDQGDIVVATHSDHFVIEI